MRILVHVVGALIILVAIYLIPISLILGALGFVFTAVFSTGPTYEQADSNARGGPIPVDSGSKPDRHSAEVKIRSDSSVTLLQYRNSLRLNINIKNDTDFHAVISSISCRFLLSPDIGPRDKVSAREPIKIFVQKGEEVRRELGFSFEFSEQGRALMYHAERNRTQGFSLADSTCEYSVSLSVAGAYGTINNPRFLGFER
jgi:hypothetical protein